MVIDRLLGQPAKGYYIEIGAFHPFIYSNSYRFYRRGWRGVLIEATPGRAALFKRWRPGDRYVECAVSDQAGQAKLHLYEDGATNTTLKSVAALQTKSGFRPAGEVDVPRRRLDAILAESLAKDQPIDFLSLDVEGAEAEVLRSNDWSRFRPRLIVVEWRAPALDLLGSWQPGEALSLLRDQGYRLVGRTANSWFLAAPGVLAATELEEP